MRSCGLLGNTGQTESKSCSYVLTIGACHRTNMSHLEPGYNETLTLSDGHRHTVVCLWNALSVRRTGVIFFAFFSGERRQAWGERGARVTRDGSFRAPPVARDSRLPPLAWKTRKKKTPVLQTIFKQVFFPF